MSTREYDYRDLRRLRFPLSPSLHDVLLGAALGETFKTTAARRRTSPETVKYQRREVIAYYGAANIAHAIALAFASGELRRDEILDAT